MDFTTQQLLKKQCPACIRYLYRSRTPGFDPTERKYHHRKYRTPDARRYTPSSEADLSTGR